jgi:uncharacterized membrane protein YeaQ/YmgE (transglycosylase-associated protein family)
MSLLLVIAGVVLVILLVWAILAAIHLVLAWVIVGIIAGALAGRVVQGRGLGCLMDLVFGMAGGLLGGLVIHFADPSLLSAGGLLGLVESVIVSFLGATVILGLVRLVTPKRHRVAGRKMRPLIPR